VNIESFWLSYKDIILGYMSFFIFIQYGFNKKILIKIMILTAVVNLLYQYILVFNTNSFLVWGQHIFYVKNLDIVLANIYRQRIYMNAYDEIIIPLLWYLNSSKNFFIYLFITFFSFISNFRSRILMWLIASFATLIYYSKHILQSLQEKLIIFLSALLIIVSISMAHFVAHFQFDITFYDRLIINEKANIEPLNTRVKQILGSIEIAKTNIFGVGLGNYYDNIKKEYNPIISSDSKLVYVGAIEYIHNIFANFLVESGWLAFIIFILILREFVANDIKILKKGRSENQLFVISFWTLFSYGLFNPIVPGTYQFLFWGIRGLLVNKKK